MQGSGQGAERQLLRTGGPGERGAGHSPGTVTWIREQGQGPTRPAASQQRDPGPESRASPAQIRPLTTGASSPRHQTDRAQAVQASVQRKLWGGPAVLSPRTLPTACLPARGRHSLTQARSNSLDVTEPGRGQQREPQLWDGRVSRASSAGLRGLLPWLACVGGGLTQKKAGRVPVGPAGTLGRDSEA